MLAVLIRGVALLLMLSVLASAQCAGKCQVADCTDCPSNHGGCHHQSTSPQKDARCPHGSFAADGVQKSPVSADFDSSGHWMALPDAALRPLTFQTASIATTALMPAADAVFTRTTILRI